MHPQSKRWSFIEAATNSVTSFFLSVFVQWLIFPWFDIHVSLASNALIVAIFMGISIIRGYFFRRFFNWLTTRNIA